MIQTEHQKFPGVEQPMESVEKYEFKHEPIRGYPELRWAGKRPFRSTQYYPAQLKETYGKPVNSLDGPWLNRVYWGDNIQVMSHLLKEFRGKIKLIYIDPPFDSKANYKKIIKTRGIKAQGDLSAFEEMQYGDIWTNDKYMQYMYERTILLKELLSDEGIFMLHCDYHKSHLLRCVADEIFGADCFRNELIIKRPITKNLQAQFENITSFSCGHDNIFVYSKNRSKRIGQAYDSYASKSSDGYWHRFWSGEDRPTMRYQLLGVTITDGQWKWAEERALRAHHNYQTYLEASQKRNEFSEDLALVDYWRETGEELEFLRRSDTDTIENWFPPSDKKLANTLWTECKAYENRKDYPTQKHEDLLRLIIERFSAPGDLVLDSFMGSGTTQAVAMKLGRRFIGADINLGAVQTTTKRLIKAQEEIARKFTKPTQGKLPGEEDTIGNEPEVYYSGFSVYNVNHYDIFRNPVEAKDLLIQALEIQPLPSDIAYDGEKDGRMVKIMPINRIASRADLNELVAGFDYKLFEKRKVEHPSRPVESILLVCMGHEPDLAAYLETESGYKLDVEVVDILRDKANLEFKRQAEAKIFLRENVLIVENFYPMNLLQKLSLLRENVEDWRELVESIMIDFNYTGEFMRPSLIDIPDKNALVKGEYSVPGDYGRILVKITDLLSESLEVEIIL